MSSSTPSVLFSDDVNKSQRDADGSTCTPSTGSSVHVIAEATKHIEDNGTHNRRASDSSPSAVEKGVILSKSSRAWDIDGDGVLDETEMALKARDKHHAGTLTKEEMYQLMHENMQTQKELFKMKKVVIGLAGVTCVLALSNLGTSFAAAILSKDTQTQNAVLTDKVTGAAVRTDSFAHIYKADEEKTRRYRERRLENCTEEEDEGWTCDFHTQVVSIEDGLRMLAECMQGSDVDIQFTNSTTGVVSDLCLCPAVGGATYVTDADDVPTSGTIQRTDAGMTFTIAPYDHEGEAHYHVDW